MPVCRSSFATNCTNDTNGARLCDAPAGLPNPADLPIQLERMGAGARNRGFTTRRRSPARPWPGPGVGCCTQIETPGFSSLAGVQYITHQGQFQVGGHGCAFCESVAPGGHVSARCSSRIAKSGGPGDSGICHPEPEQYRSVAEVPPRRRISPGVPTRCLTAFGMT